MINDNEKPIFPNSITGVILIDKKEYYLNYQHDKISPISNNEPISLGRLIISPKERIANDSYIQYRSQTDLLSNESINQSLLANDPLLIKKIVSMLEGTLNNKQIYKIENNIFKIISNVKEGINLIIFSCKLTQVNLESFDEILMNSINYFKKKKEQKDKLNVLFKSQKTKEEDLNRIYTTLERDLHNKESNLLKGLCVELNKKKEQLRKMNRILNEDIDEIDNNTLNLTRVASNKKNDDPYGNPVSSFNLSLSDL